MPSHYGTAKNRARKVYRRLYKNVAKPAKMGSLVMTQVDESQRNGFSIRTENRPLPVIAISIGM